LIYTVKGVQNIMGFKVTAKKNYKKNYKKNIEILREEPKVV